MAAFDRADNELIFSRLLFHAKGRPGRDEVS